MNPSLFYCWLISQSKRDSEIGRIAREVEKDKTFPRGTNKLHLLLDYYDNEPDDREAIKTAHAVFRRSLIVSKSKTEVLLDRSRCVYCKEFVLKAEQSLMLERSPGENFHRFIHSKCYDKVNGISNETPSNS